MGEKKYMQDPKHKKLSQIYKKKNSDEYYV